jgi:diaminohydroxyphosphoribosylaminopyrimidine deaminase/5-amino-6-(5-phosphoribosylamino)uracil reductase
MPTVYRTPDRRKRFSVRPPDLAPGKLPAGIFCERGKRSMHLPTLNDEFYMRLALQLAAGTAGQTGLNPAVGCVVVKDGRIVGTGAHLKRGEAHAEVHALDMAGAEAEGATVYVTLEPCSHHGKTPPCADRLIREKVARVVVAAVDPNPQVAGRGIARLREAGITVEQGLLAEEARRLNEAFEKRITTGMPFVTLKAACTLDGKLATKTGDSKWISNEAARERVHAMRHRHQAVMVGIGTVLADDPQLTARLPVPALQPARVVVDAGLRTPTDARLLDDAGEVPVLIFASEEASPEKEAALAAKGARVIRAGTGGKVDLPLMMRKLAELEIGSVLLEGGGRLNGAMLEAGLVDKVVLFLAPLVVGSREATPVFDFPGVERIAEAYRLERVEAEVIGDNICITGYPVKRT